MGNKQGANTQTHVPGSQRQKDIKVKDDKKRDKGDKERRRREEKEQRKTKHAAKRKQRLGEDPDGSSHLTAGDDSESSVFHSVENVSGSPYLDARTMSEMEQLSTKAGGPSSSWSSSSGEAFESHLLHRQPDIPSVSAASSSLSPSQKFHSSGLTHGVQRQDLHHPMILSSSRDFRDGFSLEAFIPPEIATPARSQAASSSSRLRPDRTGSGSNQATPTSSRRQLSYMAALADDDDIDGYKTPQATTPVAQRAHPHGGAETKPASGLDTSMTSTSSKSSLSYNIFNHPFFNKGTHKRDQSQRSHSQRDHDHQQQQHQQPRQIISDESSQPRPDLDPHVHPLVPDYRNVPKPTSPHPQRRALSPKMLLTPKRLISSDDSSSSPTTPTPQRRAANLLNLFRPNKDKKDKKSKERSDEKDHQQETAREIYIDKSKGATSPQRQDNEKPTKRRWKTWERSADSKKSTEKTKRLSIFGTSRKTEGGKSPRDSWKPAFAVDVVRLSSFDQTAMTRSTPSYCSTSLTAEAMARALATPTTAAETSTMHAETSQALHGAAPPGRCYEGSATQNQHEKAQQLSSTQIAPFIRRPKKTLPPGSSKISRTSSNRSSDSNLEAKTTDGLGILKRASSSPPTTKSAAFCIMKLEELERAIEDTIREKFPDAEPFILRKPCTSSNEEDEVKEARSMPTTPSMKKKKYLRREDRDTNGAGAHRQGRGDDSSASHSNGDAQDSNGGITNNVETTPPPIRSPEKESQLTCTTAVIRNSKEYKSSKGGNSHNGKQQAVMYESVPSPSMSPVIFRRFGAQTRHASISPKVPRAKTAVLYSSPNEMKKLEENVVASSSITTREEEGEELQFSLTQKPPLIALTSSPNEGMPATLTRKISSPFPLPVDIRSSVDSDLSGSKDGSFRSSLLRSKASSSSNSDVNSVTINPLVPAQKSTSKYDNVMDDEEVPYYAAIIKNASKGRGMYKNEQQEKSSAPSSPILLSTTPARLAQTTLPPGKGKHPLVRQKMEERSSQGNETDISGVSGGLSKVKGTGVQDLAIGQVKDVHMCENNRVGDTIMPIPLPVSERQGVLQHKVYTTSPDVFGSVSPKLERRVPYTDSANRESGKTGLAQTTRSKVEKVPLLKSISVDSSSNTRQLQVSQGRLDPRGGSHLMDVSAPAVPFAPEEDLPPKQQVSLSSSQKTYPLQQKGLTDAVSAVSVRERIKSLNKSVSEGWAASERLSPLPPSSPPHTCLHSPVFASTTHVISGPQPYPHFSSERGGKIIPSSPSSKFGAMHHLGAQVTLPSHLPPPPLSLLTVATGSGKQHPQLGKDVMVESATTLGLTSPRSSRKHSSDYVVFGNAVALPCRVYAQPTSPTTSQPAPLSPRGNLEALPQGGKERVCRAKDSSSVAATRAKNTGKSLSQEDQNTFASKPSERRGYNDQVITFSNDRCKEVKNASEMTRREEMRDGEPSQRFSKSQAGAKASSWSHDQANSNARSKPDDKRDREILQGLVEEALPIHREKLESRAQDEKELQHTDTSQLKSRTKIKGSTTFISHQVPPTSSSSSPPSLSTALSSLSAQEKIPTSSVSTIVEPHTSVNVRVSCVANSKSRISRSSESVISPDSICSVASQPKTEHLTGQVTANLGVSDSIRRKTFIIDSGRDNILSSQLPNTTCVADKTQPASTNVHPTERVVSVEHPQGQKTSSKQQAASLRSELNPQIQTVKGKHSPQQRYVESTAQQNIESPDVYKPKLKNLDEEQKLGSERQPLSKVISNMISMGQQQLEQQRTSNQQQQQQQKQQQRYLHQEDQPRDETEPQRQRRRRAQPPEHHLERQKKLQEHLGITHPQQHSTTQQGPPRSQTSDQKTMCQDEPLKQILKPPTTHVVASTFYLECSTDSLNSCDASVGGQSTHRPIKVQCESREIQTDIVTKADKAVSSSFPLPTTATPGLSLRRETESSATGGSPQHQRQQVANRGIKNDEGKRRQSENSAEDSEAEFLKKVKSFLSTRNEERKLNTGSDSEADLTKSVECRPGSAEKETESNVPPPSPTAMERLIHEMEEEDSDDEQEQKREIEEAMQKEAEMRIFTNKIYKRLSDLLYSDSYEEELVEEDDDKTEGASKGAESDNSYKNLDVKDDDDDEVFKPSDAALVPSNITRLSQERTRQRSASEFSDYSEENKDEVTRSDFSDKMQNSDNGEIPLGNAPQPTGYYSKAPPRLLTIESSSSLTTTTESESEVEEPSPVIVFKPPPSQNSTELRKLRDYREDPELPNLLRNAIISRNLGADLWDEDDRSKTRSPVMKDTAASRQSALLPLVQGAETKSGLGLEAQEEIYTQRQVQQQHCAPLPSNQQQQGHRSSREYHSDDDVVAGRGVPDYYDDATLWVTKRQARPPVPFSQMSLAVVAQRRRERRERWLKKRRRNRTDILSSTGGSSDTDREQPPPPPSTYSAQRVAPRTAGNTFSNRREPCLSSAEAVTLSDRRLHRLVSGSSLEVFDDYHEDADERAERINPHDLGSGILADPKYAKPILPAFLGAALDQSKATKDPRPIKKPVINVMAESFGHDYSRSDRQPPIIFHRRGDEGGELTSPTASTKSFSDIPGIEETFHELKSVQNILEEMQDKEASCLDAKPPANPLHRHHQAAGASPSLLSPLTKDNVRSLRDSDKTSNNRRSRMSLTDRTESDLDLYSERGHDDENNASSGSEYADDEGEDDNDADDGQTSYVTADDDLDASSGGGRAWPSGCLTASDGSSGLRKSEGTLSDEFESDYLVGCTFYNSSVMPSPGEQASSGAATTSILSTCTRDSRRSGGGLQLDLPTAAWGLAGTSVPTTVIWGGNTTGATPTGEMSSSTSTATLLLSPSPSEGGAGVAPFVSDSISSHPRNTQQMPRSCSREEHLRQSEYTPADSVVNTGPAVRRVAGSDHRGGQTFQSARNQMQDIQSHLQALRRQMAVLPDEEKDREGNKSRAGAMYEKGKE